MYGSVVFWYVLQDKDYFAERKKMFEHFIRFTKYQKPEWKRKSNIFSN